MVNPKIVVTRLSTVIGMSAVVFAILTDPVSAYHLLEPVVITQPRFRSCDIVISTNSCTVLPPLTKLLDNPHVFTDYTDKGTADMDASNNLKFLSLDLNKAHHHWYCDEDEQQPWLELDLDWCLAKWHDGKLVDSEG